MSYLESVLKPLLSMLFFVFLISMTGYLLGSIKIKGISLGTSGVLLSALLFGILFSQIGTLEVGGYSFVLFDPAMSKPLYSLISSIGTALFVAAVGLIAGPTFLRNIKAHSLGYALLGACIVGVGVAVMLLFQRFAKLSFSMATGLLTGALTSTPGLSAAKEVALDPDAVTAGYGIAYLFGVLGVVFFVQLVPKFLHTNMAIAREEISTASPPIIPSLQDNYHKVDSLGFFPITIIIVLGTLLGCIRIPGLNFSLGNSGGILLMGLLLGHFGHLGPLDLKVAARTLSFFRELGLMLFLVGAGVPAGINFISYIKFSYFLYGIAITFFPMLAGFLVARLVLRLDLLDSLGAITGGMTSTPALGTLISVAGTDQVVTAYAATYPVALVSLVIAAKFIAGQ